MEADRETGDSDGTDGGGRRPVEEGDTRDSTDLDASRRPADGDGSPPDPGAADGPSMRTNGHRTPADGVASDGFPEREARDSGERSLGRYLAAGESLTFVADGTLLGEYRSGATVGLTGARLLVATETGEFLSVGLDRISSVRSTLRRTVDVDLGDARLAYAVGYVLAIVGFLGVLGGAGSAVSPVLTLVTVAGVFAADRVRRSGVPVGLSDLDASVADGAWVQKAAARLHAARDRLAEYVTEDDQLRWAAVALAVAPFLGLVVIEGGLAVPAFALLTVGGIGLVVHTFRNEASLDGIELDLRRQRTVTACLDDGRTVTVRTAVDADLDRQLAGEAVAAEPRETGTARSSPR